jgi:hypothetical protein
MFAKITPIKLPPIVYRHAATRDASTEAVPRRSVRFILTKHERAVILSLKRIHDRFSTISVRTDSLTTFAMLLIASRELGYRPSFLMDENRAMPQWNMPFVNSRRMALLNRQVLYCYKEGRTTQQFGAGMSEGKIYLFGYFDGASEVSISSYLVFNANLLYSPIQFESFEQLKIKKGNYNINTYMEKYLTEIKEVITA